MDPAIRRERTVKRFLFVFSLLVFLVLQEGAITGSDGASMYQVTRSIVEDHDLSIDPRFGVEGRDGASYSKYGLGQPAVALIPYVVAWPVAKVAGDRGDTIEQFAVSMMVPVIAAFLVVALYALARRLGGGPVASAIVGGGAVAGTFLLPYTKEFFSEPLATLAIVLAIERTLAASPSLAGAALAGAIVTRPQSIAVLPLFAYGIWKTSGLHGLLRSGGFVALGLSVALGYNQARFGDLMEFGYGAEPGFTTPFWTGARGLLFDPAESLLLFAPIIVLVPVALASIRREQRTAVLLLGGNFLITFAITATWHSWGGGWSWGPRLLIPGIAPAIAAIAPWATGRINQLRAVAGFLLLGLAVSFGAMLVSTRAQQLNEPPPSVGPSVFRQYERLPRTMSFTASHWDQRDEGDHRRFLSLWQVNAIGVLGGPGLSVVIPLTAALIAGASYAGVGLVREVRAADQSGEP